MHYTASGLCRSVAYVKNLDARLKAFLVTLQAISFDKY